MPPVSVPWQPPRQTQHQIRPKTGSACLLPSWPYLRMLLLRRLPSRSAFLLPCFTFGPSLRLREATTAAADFWRLIPAPLDAGSPKASRQISPGITHSLSRLCLSDLHHGVPCKYWALRKLARSPTVKPLSASCSSGQRFAYSFLQIPPRDGHPCRSANTSPCRVCRGLTPPSECALPGAQTKKTAGYAVPFKCSRRGLK
jgi:hypothetical protein